MALEKEKKKEKGKLMSEREIRKRRKELHKILEETNDSETIPYKECIKGVIAEFNSILGEEKETEKKPRRIYEEENKQLKEEVEKLQTQIQILMRGK